MEAELGHIQSIAPSNTQWRILDHCAAVGRLYALFEQFFEGIIADWLLFRSSGRVYADLPEKIKDAYADGFAHILPQASKARYSHLSATDMISEYHSALSGSSGYRLFSECLTYHKNNLRWGDINEIFSRCGISDFDQWIATSPDMVRHFETDKRVVEQSSSKLSLFIQYRNDAAHGLASLDEILGPAELEDYADFVRSLCVSMHEFLLKKSILYLEEIGSASKVGTVKETFSNNRTVCFLEGAKISVGDTLHIVTDKSCSTRKVISLMLDDVATNQAIIAKPAEVGIAFDGLVSKRAQVFVVDRS